MLIAKRGPHRDGLSDQRPAGKGANEMTVGGKQWSKQREPEVQRLEILVMITEQQRLVLAE